MLTRTRFLLPGPVPCPLVPSVRSPLQNQLATLRTVTSLVLGSLCGLLGLQNWSGFAVYLAEVALIAVAVGFGKCRGKPGRYFAAGWMALGIDQDGFLAFLCVLCLRSVRPSLARSC